MTLQLALGVALALVASACATIAGLPQNQRGGALERQGDLVGARRAYAEGLAAAKAADADPHVISMLTYNHARMEGYLCNYDAAQAELFEALALTEKHDPGDLGIATMRYLELARLNYDQGKYAESLPYYAGGVERADKIAVESVQPIAFAGVLDEWSTALEKSDRAAEAVPIRARAAALRAKSPGRSAEILFVRYDEACAASQPH